MVARKQQSLELGFLIVQYFLMMSHDFVADRVVSPQAYQFLALGFDDGAA
jgi:hypothetical protein